MCSLYAFAQNDIMQGPFKLDNESSIYIKSENNFYFPLTLYFEVKGRVYKIESYEVNGAKPHVETVFFTKINNVKNVIVLISWQQRHFAERINGTFYQVYGYDYLHGKLIKNFIIKNGQNLNGLDGEIDGEELHFKYENAGEIRECIKSAY